MVLFRRRGAEKRLAKIKAMKGIRLITIVNLSCQLIFSPLYAQTLTNDCVVLDWQITNSKERGSTFDRRKIFNRDDKRVYAFISLNCTHTASNLRFLFLRNKKLYAEIKLPLRPSKRWRTRASVKTLKGRWLVKVYAGGRFLLSDTFLVR